MSVALAAVAVASGIVGWSGEPLLLPIAMLFPAFWAFAPSRIGAVLVSAGYFLAASRGLPQGVANFYGSGFGAGLALWIGAAVGFTLVHSVLWTARSSMVRASRYLLVAMLMSVPPFGIVGWAHPITAAGVVFPAWGWWGLAAAAIGLSVMTTRFWPITILILGGLWIWSAATWTAPTVPEGWIGLDTKFGGGQDAYAGYDQHLETIAMVRAAAADGATVVVLPEGAAGIWTDTADRLWRSAFHDVDVTVNAGAIIVNAEGYDNVMLDLSRGEASVLYKERMPVPVSMWQPWLALSGQGGGAQAHFFANPSVEFAGKRIAPLICYEQLLIWPALQSAIYAPEIIVATGNGWWTTGTNIVAIQEAAAVAWARLFDIPLILAFNT
ncbi:conjugal transfer protein TraB [Aquamicrobium sp. NLF2-7]|uniref:conjugal transfer protein TraB n=1 Tax=Aquamicrobium sp. NLF2-7 TaxID=2918753 RepID=UPI001EFAF074|nr:conjugal transfer protein TraB [Aquamicrobium sp. NLF2-7]